jgi:hypothetical protein
MRAAPNNVQERLGHSSITITLDRYGHLFKGDDAGELDEAANALCPLMTQSGHLARDLFQLIPRSEVTPGIAPNRRLRERYGLPQGGRRPSEC